MSDVDRPPAARAVRRSRWAAIGAALAVSVGAGGVLTSWAGTSGTEPTVFVPMTPCRLLDTRPAPDNVGARDTALGPTEVFATAGRGTVGNCIIPAEATALSMNVAAINPTAASFLTVYPADAPRPVSANLNWVARQAPTPNAVTAGLSADGRLALFNLAGTVDVSIDVVGYYAPAKQALTDVSSDVVDLGRTIETVTSQIGALQTAVSTLATPQEVTSAPISVPSNVTAQQSVQTGSVTTNSAGRWWISAAYNLSVTCSSGSSYLVFLMVDNSIIPSTIVAGNGSLLGRVTFAGPTPASLTAGAHTVKVGAWCNAGTATLGGLPNTSVVNVMVLR